MIRVYILCMTVVALSMLAVAQSNGQTVGDDKVPEWKLNEDLIKGQWYVTDKNGNVLYDTPFEHISFNKEKGIGFALDFKNSGKCYVFSTDGTLLVSYQMESEDSHPYCYDCFFRFTKSDQKTALYDYNGNLLMEDIDFFYTACSTSLIDIGASVFIIEKGGEQHCYSADLRLMPGEFNAPDQKFITLQSKLYFVKSTKGILNEGGAVVVSGNADAQLMSYYDMLGYKYCDKLYKKYASRFRSKEEFDGLAFILHREIINRHSCVQLFDMSGKELTPLILDEKKFEKAKIKAITEYVRNFSDADRERIYQVYTKPHEEIERRKEGLPRYCTVQGGETFYAHLQKEKDEQIRREQLAKAKAEAEEKARLAKAKVLAQKEAAKQKALVARQRRTNSRQSQTAQKPRPTNNVSAAKRGQGQASRPLGCYAASGIDRPNRAYDGKVGSNTDCSWTRPPRGNKDSQGWQRYVCSFDSQQAISIKVSFHQDIQKWVATSQVGKYSPCSDSHVLVGENDKFWVFSNCELLMPNSKSYNLRQGYDLYVAKDWTIVGLSNDPEVVYDELVSPRKYSETLCNVKVVGLSPQGRVTAQMAAFADALHQQNQADIKRQIDECDKKIDAINRGSVERYTKGHSGKSSSSTVRGIRYAPDYTGAKYSYWCDECRKWGPLHSHYDLK